MAMQCPRCATELREFPRTDRTGAQSVDADICFGCGGVWFDGTEVAAAHPGLASLRERRRELLILRGNGAAIANCPRCASQSVEFPFLDVKLDYCLSCHGVWVDGPEVLALSGGEIAERPSAVGPNAAALGPAYRSAAVEAVRTGVVSCKRCACAVALSDTLMTGEGAMCVACAQSWEGSADEGDPAEREFLKAIRSSDGSMWEFVTTVGGGLVGLLAACAPCSHCGHAHSHSHCHHRH